MNIFLLIYFICPKIDILSFDGISTGLRIQDFIALIFLFKFINNSKFLNLSLLTFLYIAINLFFSYYNNNIFNSILGWVRIFEYYVIGYAIYEYLSNRDFKILILVQLILIPLQFFLLLPNFDPGRGIILSSEYSGSFGTPAELSYFLGLICFLYKERLSFLSQFLLTPIIISNGVKASVLIPLVNLTCKILINTKIKILIILCVGILGILFYNDEFDTLINFLRIILNFDFSLFDHEYFKEKDFYFHDDSIPQTLNMRVIKWGVALHLFINSNLLQILFGNGLYLTGGALDSGIIRFIYELGLIPLFLFLTRLLNKNISCILVIIFSNIFFDAWISSITAPIIIAIYLKYTNE
jgi:hypothetical protein